MSDIKRQTARKCRIIDIINGRYVRKEGWEPNYIVTNIGNVSRVNILAIVVSKTENNNILIDDGTGKIPVRSFEDTKLLNLNIGDTLIIIGRPRLFNEEKYILPEIVKKITDKKWIEARKLELELLRKDKENVKEVKEEFVKEKTVKKESENYNEMILKRIRDLDKGSGAVIEEITKNLDSKKVEMIINNLLEEGEIFEIKPGKLKIL